jgi:uncharacterized caspase-like protein
VIRLIDTDATAAGIKRAMLSFVRDWQMKPTDTFVLYMAGHGKYFNGHFYYVPQDFTPTADADIVNDPISETNLVSWLTQIRALNQVIILDTCESGRAVGTLGTSLAAERATAWGQLSSSIGSEMLAAATETAFESNQYKHGLLTYGLLEALQAKPDGDHGRVTFNMAVSNAQERVHDLSYDIWQQYQEPVQNLVGVVIPLGYRFAPFDLVPVP